MTESLPTRDRLVAAMADLMRFQGYGATSVKQVVDHASAPIGSLYHFFPQGKRQIAADALRSTGAAYIALVPVLLDPHDDLSSGLRAFFDAAAEDMERAGWANMCPVGTVAAEIADTEPELREIAAGIVSSWIDQSTAYLVGRGLDPDQARRVTVMALAALEGAFLLARTLRSTEALHVAGETLAGLVSHVPLTAGS